ncbi:MAG TPA: TIM barrel protein [Candidatus Diapherotrites archaeon]|nr:TIM barrel protein [Candidatus Diapherotrites archaeon]
MIHFGPSGNSDSFYEQGYKSSLDMPAWLRNMGLDAYEYSCARGVRIKPDMAGQLGAAARENGITLSVHAPYYINLASEEPEAVKKSFDYIIDTSVTAELMGAMRVVLHPGSLGKLTRDKAFNNIRSNLFRVLEIINNKGIKVSLCPETLGKKNQMGTLDEILELCLLDELLIPTVDFAHLHALGSGALRKREDYEKVFDRIFTVLGEKRGRLMHMHYSRVEYTEKGGEKKHWSYDDVEYGPEFEPLAECLIKFGISGTIISESRGTMAEDALKIKKIYGRLSKENLYAMEKLC